MIVSKLLNLLNQLCTHEPSSSEPLNAALLEHLQERYGGGELLGIKLGSMRSACALFLEAYGDGPVKMIRAPARINVLGEHVDYVSYLPTSSLTFGSREHEMILLYRPAGNGRVRGRSTLANCEPFSFQLEDEAVEGSGDAVQVWERFLFSRPSPAPDWSNYVRGAARFARLKHGDEVRTGMDFVIDSSVPPAGGASSSSALTVLAGAALLRANGIPRTPLDLAFDSSKAEWYVGTRGGAMDHLTICLSRENHAVHISYADGLCSQILLPGAPYCWLTFFSHGADKSKEVMLEYNERAAVSRIWIPALLEDWTESNPSLHHRWQVAKEVLCAGSFTVLDELDRLFENLPETITLSEMKDRHPEAFLGCERAFPALIRERSYKPLRLRDRAGHHLGEVRRVAEAVNELRPAAAHASAADSVMHRIGRLLTASHGSLRDLYGLCTPEVERLVEIISSAPGVYGARLMGGGFGGNILALTTEDRARSLIARVQEGFYGPRGRVGEREGSIMLSTPGAGVSELGIEGALRRQLERFNRSGPDADQSRTRVRGLLGRHGSELGFEVWPIVVAAGEGKRAKASGLKAPKPLVKVLDTPVVARVFNSVKQACHASRPIVVIVSPETQAAVRDVLSGEDISWVVQTRALGTGDAVLCARETMRDFRGRVLVVWGTQPVLRPETISLTLILATLFPEYPMVFPTTLMTRPYAPVWRDESGRVSAADETHLESAVAPEFGESNVGLFLLQSEIMFRELEELRRLAWKEAENRYDRAGGELGFPNEMIRRLAGRAAGILASPIADWREEKGIKTAADVPLCEQYIRDLQLGGQGPGARD